MNRTVNTDRTTMVVPLSKAVLYTLLISLITGYAHILFLGFHPILQGGVAGLLCGTITGKLLSINRFKLETIREAFLWSLLLMSAFLAGQSAGVTLAIPKHDFMFLISTWKLDDFRDIIQWNLLSQTDLYVDKVERSRWLFWVLADVFVFYVIGAFSLKLANRISRRPKHRLSEWPVYRMFLIFICFILSIYFTSKPEIAQNRKELAAWKEEIWADGVLSRMYANIDGLVSDRLSKEAIALEDITKTTRDSEHPFPEGHLLQALQQLREGNFYLAKEEIERAIYQMGNLIRRPVMASGIRLNRDQLLAHLYQFRAKLNLKKEKVLIAERDLSVAIMLHQEYWITQDHIPETGFFPHQDEILREAGYFPLFGFGACHYERYLARRSLNPEQAQEDLDEAISLGLKVPRTPLP